MKCQHLAYLYRYLESVGATPYPYGPEEDSEVYNFWGKGIWEQISLTLNEGNIFNYNCRKFDKIYVSCMYT